MADAAAPKVDTHHEPIDPSILRRVRKIGIVVAIAALAGVTWFVLREVNEGKADERWARLDAVEAPYRDTGSTRRWMTPAEAVDLAVSDKHAKALEDFLPTAGDDAGLAAHVHARIVDVRLSQAFRQMAAGGGGDIDGYLAAAQQHLETLRDKFPDAPGNWARFGKGIATKGQRAVDNPSLVRAALDAVAGLRAWEKQHAVGKVEPDADPVVVLRTTAGDLRLRLFASASPRTVAAFLERVCNNGLAGVRVFERRDGLDEGWLRVGDDRTKAAPTTDDDRVAWDEPTPGEPRVPEAGRFRILHAKGVVTTWHGPADDDDDPQQFLLVTRDSTSLNFEHTPFAKIEDAPSLAVLDRMAGLATYAKDQPDIRGKKPALADQLVKAPVVVKALVFEKGAAKACAVQPDDDEKTLDGLKADKHYVPEPPPAPPAAPAPGAAMDGDRPQ